MRYKSFISFLVYLAHAVLNSYAMLFFSNQKLFGALILIVSFFNPFTGIGGLSATIIAVIAAYGIGFSSDQVKTGFYTYSALLLGLGMGTFYELSMGYWLLLPLASLVAVLVSAALIAKLGKQNLPALSLSFILTFWLVILASKEFTAVGLTQRNIYWLNEMYATGGSKLIQLIQQIDSLDIPDAVAGFLRSLSAILFQSNIAAGILLVIGLLIYSRIALLLSILGYATAMIFISLMGAGGVGINYYNVGTNFMLVAIALGGFYIIPSTRSFLWAIITVPISYLLVLGLSKITYTWGLPVFSLPFCITVILFLYCLQLRKTPGKLVLTPVQYYSPEINLYTYINEKERWMNTVYHQLALPFMGEWMVSQGYDGDLTHKGDWAKALDFVILDNEMKTYRFPGNLPEHFYCYNKPVLAPADGTVVEIIDFIEDNEIGGNNTQQNWGNTIVIKHAEGLYTKLSHLKKHSFKVAKGAFVKKGEIIAHVGNSGRSPEPHLHFQVQANPYVGSKTISYPFAYFTVRDNSNILLNNFKIPKEGSFISNIIGNDQLQQAFNFQPGLLVKVNAKDFQEEEWEVFTSVYNETYFYCKQTKAAAYFKHNGNAFYFTHFMGEKDNLLFYFYEAAYKVLLSSENKINVKDNFPLSVYSLNAVKWLQDLLSPFYIFINMQFQSEVKKDSNTLTGNSISFTSKKLLNLFGKEKHLSTAHVKIENNRLHSFTVQTNNKTIAAICTV